MSASDSGVRIEVLQANDSTGRYTLTLDGLTGGQLDHLRAVAHEECQKVADETEEYHLLRELAVLLDGWLRR